MCKRILVSNFVVDQVMKKILFAHNVDHASSVYSVLYQLFFVVMLGNLVTLLYFSSLLAMAGALRKVGAHIQDGLARIQEKSWAEPLGKGLGVGAKIVDCMGSFVPGAGILGGAMALGASLLNPEPSMEDLQTSRK